MKFLFPLASLFFSTVLCLSAAALPDPPALPDEYYKEPVDLPYSETVLKEGQETGWKWTEFLFTSVLVDGQPVRIQALYALPDAASAANKVPAIIMTHGKFGEINQKDPRYLAAVSDLAKAGYAVLFFAWNPDPQIKAGPLPADAPEPSYSTFPIDYSKDWNPVGDDWKRSIFYQAMMAGKRSITWISAKPEIDTTRIGATGASYGGIFSSLLAAIDLRIVAVVPTVYSTGFGPEEPSYNRLPKTFSAEDVQTWRARFDSEWLLNQRKTPVPLLYSIATNDPAFRILKAAQHYKALPEPKQMVITPNEGHNFWNFKQTVLFFDEILQKKGSRPAIGEIVLLQAGQTLSLSVMTDAPKVDYFYALEPLHDMTLREDRRSDSSKWKWEKLIATVADGKAAAILDLPPGSREQTQNLHLFARGTNAEGAEACSPLFSLPMVPAKPTGASTSP